MSTLWYGYCINIAKRDEIMYTRTMTKDVIYFKGKFNGIYYWGDGFVEGAGKKWFDFWHFVFHQKDRYHWHLTFNGETPYLVAIQGSIFMHPMDFSGILLGTGGTSGGKAFGSDISELIAICNECAEYCGGTFSFQCTDELEVEFQIHDPMETYKDYQGVGAERMREACEKLV